MGERIRQFFLSILGIGTFAFIFYLVFRENQRFMIVFLISLGGLVVIILLVGLILRIKDNADAKRRTKPFKRI
jgi:hypothetical protein